VTFQQIKCVIYIAEEASNHAPELFVSDKLEKVWKESVEIHFDVGQIPFLEEGLTSVVDGDLRIKIRT
jgi:hypothetical protein